MSEFRPRFLRERPASQILPKIARSFRGDPSISRTPGATPWVSPYQVLCVVGSPEISRHLGKNTLSFAPAGSFAAERAIEQRLSTDHEYDAYHLHPHREAHRVKFANRP